MGTKHDRTHGSIVDEMLDYLGMKMYSETGWSFCNITPQSRLWIVLIYYGGKTYQEYKLSFPSPPEKTHKKHTKKNWS